MSFFKRFLVKEFTLLIFFLTVWGGMAVAQNCIVSGKVTEEKGEPIQYASVVVSQGGKDIAGTITQENGAFSLQVKASDSLYTLQVFFVGYTSKSLTFNASKEKVQLPNIVLSQNTQTLGEVAVEAQVNGKRSSVERTSLNPQAYMTEMTGSVADILRSSAAVSVNPQGQVSVRGKKNVLLLLDGVPTTMEELSALSSSNIKSIDIITNPDASYDAEGTGGIINIISQKEKGKGFSGQIGANYGFNHFVNGNIALHYVAKGFALNFSYQTKYEDDIIHGNLYRKFVQSGNSLEQQVRSARTVFNNNIALGATFHINSKNKLQADLRLNIPRLNTKQDFDNLYLTEGIERQEYRSRNVSWNRENIEGVLFYQHIIQPNKLSFSIRSSISKIWGHRPSYYFLNSDSVSKSVSGGSPLLTAHQLDFNIKKKYGTWETGVKFSYRQNNIYHDFYSRENQQWNYSPAFSKDLAHREFIPAAYVQFSSPKGKKLFGKAGIRIEYSQVKLSSEKENIKRTQHHLFIAPSLMGQYKINEQHSISLAFSRRISRPTYPQLNPYMSMLDATTFEQGNPYLQPETSENVEFNYLLSTKIVDFSANLYFNYTHNYITEITILKDSLLLLTYINGLSELRTGLDLQLTIHPAKWVDIDMNANTYYVSAKGQYEQIDLSNKGWVNSSLIELNFKPIKGMNIQLQYSFTTPEYYPQFTIPFAHAMNIGISQKFLKGSLTVSALLTDVFNTNNWEVNSNNSVYILRNESYNKSRMFWLGIRYNFNSYQGSKPMKKAEDDRSKVHIGQ